MGRKALPDDERLGDWLHIRISRDERARLIEHAQRRGVRVSEAIRAELAPILADSEAQQESDSIAMR